MTAPALPKLQDLGTDLLHVSGYRRAWSLLAPFFWCGLYIWLACHQLWPLAILCLIWLNFITYASVSHDLVHGTLGLPKFWNDLFLSLIEGLTLHSGHAYQKAHLHHHRVFPDALDIEGAAAGRSWWEALGYGVLFQFRIWMWALHKDHHSRGLILAEGLFCLAAVILAVLSYRQVPVYTAYVMMMLIGSWVIPFATSYLVHDPHAADELHQTRLFRGRLFSLLAFEHLYHLEHHLYPAVPHYHWPQLAQRLDPYFTAHRLPVIRSPFQKKQPHR